MRYLQSDSRLSTLPFNFRLVRGGSVGPMNMIEFLPHSSSAFVNHHVHIGKQITNLCYISIIVFCIRLRSGILFGCASDSVLDFFFVVIEDSALPFAAIMSSRIASLYTESDFHSLYRRPDPNFSSNLYETQTDALQQTPSVSIYPY